MKAYSQIFVSMKQAVAWLSGIDFFPAQGTESFHLQRMSKQAINEIRRGLWRFFNQQDDPHPVFDPPNVLARNLNDAIFDCSLEFYSLHASPHSVVAEPMAYWRAESPGSNPSNHLKSLAYRLELRDFLPF
jgi:hypothetical protein